MAADVLMRHPKLDAERGDDKGYPSRTTREAFDLVWKPKGWVEVGEDGTPVGETTAASAETTSTDATGPGAQLEPTTQSAGRAGKGA